MATKTGGGNQQQPYNEKDGRYQESSIGNSGKTKIQKPKLAERLKRLGQKSQKIRKTNPERFYKKLKKAKQNTKS